MFGANSHTFTKVFVRFWLFMAPKELNNAQWLLLVAETDQWAVVWGCCWPVLMMLFWQWPQQLVFLQVGFAIVNFELPISSARIMSLGLQTWIFSHGIPHSTSYLWITLKHNQFNIIEGNTVVQSVCVSHVTGDFWTQPRGTIWKIPDIDFLNSAHGVMFRNIRYLRIQTVSLNCMLGNYVKLVNCIKAQKLTTVDHSVVKLHW